MADPTPEAATIASKNPHVEQALERCEDAQAAYLAAVQERKDAIAAAVHVRATYAEIADRMGLSRGHAHHLGVDGHV